MDQRVIRGLPREMSVNDIKEDLVSQGIADAVVQQLTSRTTKKPLPLFLVKTKMPEKLAEIQRLAMLTVSFERKKKSSEPSQCYRCQRYGHTQRNCRLAERCVKCGEDHNSTSCKAVNAPWYVPNRVLYEDLRQVPVLEVMKTRARKFFNNAEEHENQLIKAALDYDPRFIHRHKRPKSQLLEDMGHSS
ncbi:unnamed protein product [Acanthoscelides obtectus]|nr:unnamed protein product [Acanthoscelides obtectus]CAK1683987.1 hypothetical protein AOBTE_LOCUS34566 [Acanthoscelides obtectus]